MAVGSVNMAGCCGRSGEDLLGRSETTDVVLQVAHNPAENFATKANRRRDATLRDKAINSTDGDSKAQCYLADIDHETHCGLPPQEGRNWRTQAPKGPPLGSAVANFC